MSSPDNYIAVIPTGTGKTFVACMVIAKMLKMNPHAKVIFLVERLPLLLQQADEISRETGVCVSSLSGDMCNYNTAEDPQVLVIMAQVYLNALTASKLSFDNVCLIVFDEVHHATKEHPYNKILDLLRRRKHQQRHLLHQYQSSLSSSSSSPSSPPPPSCPRVLGLTASPAGLSSKLTVRDALDELERNADARIISPSHDCPDLKPYTTRCDVQLSEISYSQIEFDFSHVLRSIVVPHLTAVRLPMHLITALKNEDLAPMLAYSYKRIGRGL
eukprot:TRINITY_DN2993_c0_g2_i2.p1 TRINITY_DN2993_c0_g2~~TRINITY_DN2993_c0_g2_i2.p1  ORF type:complete len:316 (+),score=71.55 TRINITY_DN2993_c0_g2_i2:135-950(+)